MKKKRVWVETATGRKRMTIDIDEARFGMGAWWKQEQIEEAKKKAMQPV